MISTRAIILTMVLISFLVCHSFSAKMERFISDFSDFYSMSSVAILINKEEPEQLIRDPRVAYISYANAELQDVVDYINGIQDELDAIFFIGSDHSELVHMLDDTTDIFHSHIVSVMENHGSLDLQLRLDTNVIFLTPTNTNFVLAEKYAIKKGPTIEKLIGNWNLEAGLHIDIPLLWERRSDLMNIELIDTVLEYPVIRKFVRNEEGVIMKQSGIGADILAVLQERLNFSTKAVPPEDKEWGSIKDDNLTWSGMVGDLVYGRADISTALLSPSYERNDVIDFSITIFEYTVTLIQPRAVSFNINALAYLTIFPVAAWMIVISMILVSAFILWSIAKYRETINISLIQATAISFFYLFQWSHETSTLLKTNAAKAGLFTWAIGCYIVLSMYEADLTAFMTSGPQESSIR